MPKRIAVNEERNKRKKLKLDFF